MNNFMKLELKVGIFIFSFLLLFQTTGYTQVVIDKRPFAIDSENMMQMIDGIFDVSKGQQIIGVFIKNTGSTTIQNVSGTISFDSSSGISITSSSYSFGDLAPNVPVLGIFEASFLSSSPGKYDLSLSLSGADDYSEVISRALFVLKSEIIGENKATMTVPEGTITIEYLSFSDSEDALTFVAPTHFKMTMIPNSPFSGQLSEIPFNDPWWKVAAITIGAAASVAYVTDGILQRCGVDTGPAAPGGEQIFIGVISLSGLVATKDIKDPFRRGEENTFPIEGELTTSEEVDVYVTYDNSPLPQDAFSGTVSWQFTRFTTGNNYT